MLKYKVFKCESIYWDQEASLSFLLVQIIPQMFLVQVNGARLLAPIGSFEMFIMCSTGAGKKLLAHLNVQEKICSIAA